jgi:hypothetical protein
VTRRRLLTVLGLVLTACQSPRDTSQAKPPDRATPAPTPAPSLAASAPPAVADAAPAKPALEPLRADAALVPLEVEGFRDAIVSVPIGATAKRPVMVALHGNYDRPEWQCEVWREITAGHPFILCPRGIPRAGAPKSEDRWEYGGVDKTEKELLLGLEALSKRFAGYVDDGPMLFTGFSLGAILGRHILLKHAKRFPRAVLTEGGYEGWSIGHAKRYRDAGGERVLFACGQHACKHASKQAARVLEKQGVTARVADGGNVGHTYDGRVARAISGEWEFLLGDDERWTAR